MSKLAISILFLFISTFVNAQEQYEVMLKLEAHGHVIKHPFLTTGAAGATNYGSTNGYWAVECSKKGATTKRSTVSKKIFAGYRFKNVVRDNILILEVGEHVVHDKNEEIDKLQQSDCKTITPDVITYVDEIKYSIQSNIPQLYKLKNGKTLTVTVNKI